jgi:hypothetical protein
MVMKHNYIKNKILIILGIIIGLGFTFFLKDNVFIANTPAIRKNFISFVTNRYSIGLSSFLGRMQGKEKRIGPGMYVYADSKQTIIRLVENEMQYDEIKRINNKGEEIIIHIPRGSKLSEEMIDLLINK